MKSINGNIVSNCVLQDIVIRDIIWNIVISKSCWWINSKQYVANTYCDVDKTSSFSFSHFCSSSSSVVWDILLVSNLVIIWSRVFLCGCENKVEYFYYIIEFCNINWNNEKPKTYFRTLTWHCFHWRFTSVVHPLSCRSTIRVSFSFSGSSSGRPLISSMISFKQLLTSFRFRSYNISFFNKLWVFNLTLCTLLGFESLVMYYVTLLPRLLIPFFYLRHLLVIYPCTSSPPNCQLS